MIQTEQSVRIAAPIDQVWAYAKDVERWAEIMPGYQECQIADEDNSRWVLKVGVGGPRAHGQGPGPRRSLGGPRGSGLFVQGRG